MGGDPDVVVIGSGPNGLTAAALLARAGLQVLVLEANQTIGGAARTAETTLPGFKHDPFSAFHPLAVAGPIGRLPLGHYGLRWCSAARAYGGATPDGRGVVQVAGDLPATQASFDHSHPGDGAAWRELFDLWEWGRPAFLSLLFNPLGHPAPLLRGLPLVRQPRRLLELAQHLAGSVEAMVDRFFGGEDAKVWLASSVLHSDLSPEDAAGGAFGLLLTGLGQRIGMPVPQGGAQAIPDALARFVEHHGGSVLTGQRAEQILVRENRAVGVRTATDQFPARRAVLATVQPQALFLRLIGASLLPSDFVKLVRRYRWGSGVVQMDLALRGLPRFKSEAANGTLVVHLGRSVAELSRGVAAVRHGLLPSHPLLITGYHTIADPSRAPAGHHTAWIMTHVPARITGDQAEQISGRDWATVREAFAERLLDELEAYAPGARDLVLGHHVQTPPDLQTADANLVGGDIGSGSYTLDQQLVFRPLPGWFRYQTPIRGLYMSGAATHPGGGVHGAAGANAARVVLSDLRLASALQQVQAAQEWLRESGPWPWPERAGRRARRIGSKTRARLSP